MAEPPVCKCGKPAELAYGVDLWPGRPDLATKHVWVCWACDARVGCHPGTKKALGELAGPSLRRIRHEVHRVFDQHWLPAKNRSKARIKAYARLAKALNIQPHECHVGMFDEARCEAALKILEGWERPTT